MPRTAAARSGGGRLRGRSGAGYAAPEPGSVDADGGGGLVDGVAQQRGVIPGRGRLVAVPGAASRRMTAWKWTTPRAWYSATLT